MINIKDYPLFIPPEEVNSQKPREWSYTQAKIYFDWFMSIKDHRVEYLLTVFDEEFSSDNEKLLKGLGKKVFETLQIAPFSTDESSGKVISNKGLAIAADISLLVSKLIIKNHPRLKWRIVRTPKRDLSFHLPAIFNFPKLGHLELMGGSIVNSKAILRGEETSDVWWRMFKYADDVLKNEDRK
ncbi:hypothetical protein [Algoriphagus boritolerans]|uniref:Uncharacterized protein n=1 Tax=Algoriphagus boritolerans DSM 17298 = JCM 18970 TaxID=1120964 RepID=A0A1H5ZBS2_9BACT|nr:hypothetical protein [Algoriphagus boritolerans]SEG33949.1 hypothetical protein SAMN03080598_03436 [Algoriphagus boritolerans DSM 17298 = JCM 18970]